MADENSTNVLDFLIPYNIFYCMLFSYLSVASETHPKDDLTWNWLVLFLFSFGKIDFFFLLVIGSKTEIDFYYRPLQDYVITPVTIETDLIILLLESLALNIKVSNGR